MDEEILEDKVEEEPEALLVKVVNKEVRESSPYDGHDDYEYEDIAITDKEVTEFEDGTTS